MSEQDMDSEDIKGLGRTVGTVTGFIGYFSGALGAWALWVITEKLDGRDPFAKGVEPRPSGMLIFAGAASGILLTMIVITAIVWKMEYYPKRFRMSPKAGGSIMLGLVNGAGAALTAFVVMLYALTMVAMWFLGSALLLLSVFLL